MSEIYISVDIEADGPIPGPNSMLSLGAVAIDVSGNELSAFTINFDQLAAASPDPDTQKWWATQPVAVFEAARSNPQPPLTATLRFRAWVEALRDRHGGTPVFVGYPAGFDFLFVYWYLVMFTGGSPFSFSAIDIKTYAMAVLGMPYREINKKELRPFIPKGMRHTHVALDDAREQGHMFVNLLHHRAAR